MPTLSAVVLEVWKKPHRVCFQFSKKNTPRSKNTLLRNMVLEVWKENTPHEIVDWVCGCPWMMSSWEFLNTRDMISYEYFWLIQKYWNYIFQFFDFTNHRENHPCLGALGQGVGDDPTRCFGARGWAITHFLAWSHFRFQFSFHFSLSISILVPFSISLDVLVLLSR